MPGLGAVSAPRPTVHRPRERTPCAGGKAAGSTLPQAAAAGFRGVKPGASIAQPPVHTGAGGCLAPTALPHFDGDGGRRFRQRAGEDVPQPVGDRDREDGPVGLLGEDLHPIVEALVLPHRQKLLHPMDVAENVATVVLSGGEKGTGKGDVELEDLVDDGRRQLTAFGVLDDDRWNGLKALGG